MRRLYLALPFLLALGGCAKFPEGGGDAASKRLIFSMTLAGDVNPNYVYIFPIRVSKEQNPPGTGPIPVIASPWGNGFVAGNVDYFVRWDPLQSPNYILYRFVNAELTQFVPIGVPIQVDDVQPGDDTLRFELDINQIAPSAAEADQLVSLQANFLTMNRVPQGNDTIGKIYEALGDTRLPTQITEFIQIPLTTSGVYNDQRFNDLEPEGDVPDPDLDVVDWSIEVRTQ